MTDPTRPSQPEPVREPLEPGTHLRLSVLYYIVINAAYGVGLALVPTVLWGTIGGADGAELDALASTRWAGAILLAWAIGGFLVLTRPAGRQTMVTTFALQYTLACLALAVSAVSDEFVFVDTWFVLVAIVATGFGAGYLWYGRFRGRAVLTA